MGLNVKWSKLWRCMTIWWKQQDCGSRIITLMLSTSSTLSGTHYGWKRSSMEHTVSAKTCLTCQKTQCWARDTNSSARCTWITPPKGRGYSDVLVRRDMFSRWGVVYPCRQAAMAKTLANEFISSLSCQIESNQGTHFTGTVCQEICRLMGIE